MIPGAPEKKRRRPSNPLPNAVPLSTLPAQVKPNLKLMYHSQLLYGQQVMSAFVRDTTTSRGWRDCKATIIKYYVSVKRADDINSYWHERKWNDAIDLTDNVKKLLQPKPRPFPIDIFPTAESIPNAQYKFVTGVEYYLDDDKETKYTMAFNLDGSYHSLQGNVERRCPHVLFVSQDWTIRWDLARVRDLPDLVYARGLNTPGARRSSALLPGVRQWRYRPK